MPFSLTPSKSTLVEIGVALVVLALVFMGGRYSRKPQVQVHEVEHRVEIQHETTTVVQKVDTDELKQMLTQFAQQVNKDVTKQIVTVVNKDGSKIVTETITDKTKTDTEKDAAVKTAVNTVATTNTAKVEDKKTVLDRTVDIKPVGSALPKWLLGVQGGVSLPHLISGNAGPNYLPYIPSQTVLGLTLDRRLFGSLYTGVFANTRGEAGLSLRLGF